MNNRFIHRGNIESKFTKARYMKLLLTMNEPNHIQFLISHIQEFLIEHKIEFLQKKFNSETFIDL